MARKKFISTREAAEKCGVSTVTIQNLCKRGMLTYKCKGKMYFVAEESLNAYNDSIQEIYQAERDIREYQAEIERKRDKLREQKEETRLELYNQMMYPRRVEALGKFASMYIESMKNHLDDYDQYGLNQVTYRGLDILKMLYDGFSVQWIAVELGITETAVRQHAYKAAQRITQMPTVEMILEKKLAEKEEEIYTLKAQKALLAAKLEEAGKSSDTKFDLLDNVDPQIVALLNTKICDLDLSVRARKSLTIRPYSQYRCPDPILTVGDLVQKTWQDLRKFRNFGRKSQVEVEMFLEGFAGGIFHLGMTMQEICALKVNA